MREEISRDELGYPEMTITIPLDEYRNLTNMNGAVTALKGMCHIILEETLEDRKNGSLYRSVNSADITVSEVLATLGDYPLFRNYVKLQDEIDREIKDAE